MKLTDILTSDRIVARMNVADKSEAIRALVQLVIASGKCSNEESLLKAVFDREAIRSTGIGHGLAVPHGKCECCGELVMALGRLSPPIDFESKDGLPAEIVVLLASPIDQTGPHVQALARISRLMLMSDFRSAISSADTAEAIYEIIAKAEA
jgi:mannitol/fructose-specific phosphotransferase system IIA component (Ntr-type)